MWTFASCVKRPSSTIKSPYVADISIENETVLAHAPSLGVSGLLIPGKDILVSKMKPGNKCAYKIEAVRDGDIWVGINPIRPNHLSKEWLLSGLLLQNVKDVKSEVKITNDDITSRIDHIVIHNDDSETMVEVKSVPLSKDNVAYFPDGYKKKKTDTVSIRANKHLTHLIHHKKSGGNSCLIFVIQREDVDDFEPHDDEFTKLYNEAISVGVNILCCVCKVDPSGIALLKTFNK